MKNHQIEKFVQQKYLDKIPVRLFFKTREPMIGVFVRVGDYEELKSKNFWRVVRSDSFEDYRKTGDQGLLKIFNGMQISKLTAVE